MAAGNHFSQFSIISVAFSLDPGELPEGLFPPNWRSQKPVVNSKTQQTLRAELPVGLLVGSLWGCEVGCGVVRLWGCGVVGYLW